jgi:hypothetical protein
VVSTVSLKEVRSLKRWMSFGMVPERDTETDAASMAVAVELFRSARYASSVAPRAP